MASKARSIQASQEKKGRYKKPVLDTSLITISPEEFDAVLFDMDGIITKTATVHAKAWKLTFDAFLKTEYPNERPFDIQDDYLKCVDGKPRRDGVKSFLESRGIQLPWGDKSDPAGFQSICAIGNLKNQEFQNLLQGHSVEVYESTVALIQSLKCSKIKVAVVTASENGVAILQAAHLLHIFDAKVDGVDANNLGLKGKPFPDTFLEGVKRLGVSPERAVVVEDAEAGVEAGHRGRFGLVIGVDRDGHEESLKAHGATIVVRDLAEVSVPGECAKLPTMAIADLKISNENWELLFEQFDPTMEGRRESLCSIGNGYLVSRGAAPESMADTIHSPGTYLAGIYNRLHSKFDGHTIEHEDLVNIPNWQYLNFRIDEGDWFNLANVNIIKFKQLLNLREGILYRQIHFTDKQGRETTLSEKRFAHMRRFHLAAIQWFIYAHNWQGKLTIRSALDGNINNLGTALYSLHNKKHLEPLEESAHSDLLYLKMRTSQSRIEIAEAANTQVKHNGQSNNITRNDIEESGFVAHDFIVDVDKGDFIDIQKIVAVYSHKDHGISEAGEAALIAVKNAPDFKTLHEEQIERWRHLWNRFDLSMDTDESIKMGVSLILHLHSFHALETASPNSIDLDVGMPARGWSEGYEGHVFWDDLFVFPYLNLRMPEITQSLLKYRYRRLESARKIARTKGKRGACFPWQSGSSGREETPAYIWYPQRKEWIPDMSHKQIHVNAAVVMNIWHYYQATDNLDFMYNYGGEMILEIARFFADMALYNEQRDRYEIHEIVGPDEYHIAYPNAEKPGINNNAYTNLMAVWCLCRAMELLKVLPEDHCNEISERLKLTKDELLNWDQISRKMFVPIQEDGIISQFEGYENLREFPWQKDGEINLQELNRELREQGGVLNQYKISKQADVLMLFYLFSSEELSELLIRLSYDYSPDWIPKNVEYYAKRTANTSTLSRVALTWVLSRADRAHAWSFLSSMSKKGGTAQSTPIASYPRAWDIFREALNSDFLDIQGGTTREGIHIGAMAGTVDIVQRCYTGIVTAQDVLWLNPQIPQEMTRLSFRLQYRGQALQIEITHSILIVSAGHATAKPIRVGFKNKVHEFHAGERKRFDIITGDQI